jgi:hypothetical protein
MTAGTINWSFKKWFFTALSCTLAAVSTVVLINCIVDTYGILRDDFSGQIREPNQRYAKMKYLLRHKDSYDSFLFGSSRALHIGSKQIRNGLYYNMGYAEGLPKDHLENIKLLMQNGVGINNVIIALDDFSYRVDPDTHLFDLVRQPHYLISGKSETVFYSEYFMKITRFAPSLRDYLRFNYGRSNAATFKKDTYDISNSGQVFCTTCDSEIEMDVEKHNNDPKFAKPYHYDGDYLSNALRDMGDIVDLTKKHKINLTVFINPIHHTTYRDTDLPLFSTFKKQLAAMTDYYDFSGLNSITTNNYYYYETSHFRPTVGDMIMKRMFGYPPIVVPRDFGVLVNRKNVDEHLKRLQQQLCTSCPTTVEAAL